jgi:hypothetical protein
MGMMPSKETFTTCEEVGRMIECFQGEVIPLTRHQVKLLICGTMRAKDANIRAAIIDMYGDGKVEAIGNKKSQGPLYGVKSHAWQALALVKALERKAHDWKNTVEAFPYVAPPKPKKKDAPKKRAAAKKVAPIKAEENDEDEEPSNEGLEEEIEKFLKDDSTVMLEDDVEWVYLHLSARNLSPSDAPSPGAWSLHSVARKDKRWFLKDIVPKIRHKKEDEDLRNMRVAEVKSIKQRQTILEGVVRRSKSSVLEVLQTRLAIDSTPKSG